MLSLLFQGGVTPLSSAAKEGHHHVFGELLSSGAEVDLADMVSMMTVVYEHHQLILYYELFIVFKTGRLHVYHTDVLSNVNVTLTNSCRMGGLHSGWQPMKVTLTVSESFSH